MFTNLPNELLLKISNYSNIDSMLELRLVCRLLNAIATDALFSNTNQETIQRLSYLLQKSANESSDLIINKNLILKTIRNPNIDIADRVNGLITIAKKFDKKLTITDTYFKQLVSHIYGSESDDDLFNALEVLPVIENILTQEQVDMIFKHVTDQNMEFYNAITKIEVLSAIASRLSKDQVNSVFQEVFDVFRCASRSIIHHEAAQFLVKVIQHLNNDQLNAIYTEILTLLQDNHEEALYVLKAMRPKLDTTQVNELLTLADKMFNLAVSENGDIFFWTYSNTSNIDKTHTAALNIYSILMESLNKDAIQSIQSSIIKSFNSELPDVTASTHVFAQTLTTQTYEEKLAITEHLLTIDNDDNKHITKDAEIVDEDNEDQEDDEDDVINKCIYKANLFHVLIPHLHNEDKIKVINNILEKLEKSNDPQIYLALLNEIIIDSIEFIDTQIIFDKILPYLDAKKISIVSHALLIFCTMSSKLTLTQMRQICDKIKNVLNDPSYDFITELLPEAIDADMHGKVDSIISHFDNIILQIIMEASDISLLLESMKFFISKLNDQQCERLLTIIVFKLRYTFATDDSVLEMLKFIKFFSDEQLNNCVNCLLKLMDTKESNALTGFAALLVLKAISPRLDANHISIFFDKLVEILKTENVITHYAAMDVVSQLAPKLSPEQIHNCNKFFIDALDDDDSMSQLSLNFLSYLVVTDKLHLDNFSNKENNTLLMLLRSIEDWHEMLTKSGEKEEKHDKLVENLMKELNAHRSVISKGNFLRKNSMFSQPQEIENQNSTDLKENTMDLSF